MNVPAQDAPNALKRFSAQIGVASGEGTVILTHAAQGSGGYDTNLPDGTRFHLLSAEPVEGNDFVSLSYSHSPLENWSVQITAVDQDGTVHGATAIQSTSGGQMGQTQARFEGLRLSAIKEFRFAVRQYQWMEFRDIALLPGERTPFEVVEAQPE